jgi:hypothetical protein
MLPNYDTKAVAEILGLAFLRGKKTDASAARTARGSKQPDFVLELDDTTVLMV